MNHLIFRGFRWLATGAVAIALFGSGGCDHDRNYSHHPPAGMGSLIVDNQGFHDVRVYLDGKLAGTVKDDHWKAFDLKPGEYRLALDERNSDRYAALDVDVLEGRRMIVEISPAGSRYDVWTHLD